MNRKLLEPAKTLTPKTAARMGERVNPKEELLVNSEKGFSSG